MSDVRDYLLDRKNILTEYNFAKEARSIRCFFRYWKARKVYCVHPKLVNDSLLYAENNDTMIRMAKAYSTRTTVFGGKPHMETIKTIRILRDSAKLPFRAIARALKSDLKTVYRQYHYPDQKYLKSGLLKS